MPDLTITADAAQRDVSQYQRKMNKGRMTPRMSKSTQRAMNNFCIQIFNVGPWPHTRGMGSIGSFYIPACLDGQPYAKMRKLPETVIELYPENEQKMGILEEDGLYVAQQIIGIGPMMSPAQSLIHFGVAIAEGEEPTAQELKKAQAALDKTLKEYVREARSAYAKGPKIFEAIVREDRHFLAAAKLGLTDEPWVSNSNPTKRLACEGCGTMHTDKVVICSACGFILDPEKYNSAAFQARLRKKA